MVVNVHKGMRVRCIKDGEFHTVWQGREANPDEKVPVKGGIYTVREVVELPEEGVNALGLTGSVGFTLEEFSENAYFTLRRFENV